MNARERLTAMLRRQPVDRISWAPLIDGYFLSGLPEQGYQMDDVAAIKHMGADLLLRHVPFCVTETANTEYSVERKGNDELRKMATPVGTLRCRFHYSGNSCFAAESWIKTLDDVKTFQYIAEDTTHKPDWEAFRETERRIGAAGMASASPPDSPLMTLLKNYCKLDKFTDLLDEDRDAVESMMNALGESDFGQYELAAQAPSDIWVFFAYENTSTTMISPRWFDKYCAPYINKYADMLHAAGKVYITHMCGKLSGLLKNIGACRQDGIDSVCPPSSGDLQVADALRAMPDKFMIGGIDPVALAQMDAVQTRQYVRKIITDCWDMRDRLVLSTGDATAYGTPLANMCAVSEALAEFY